MFWLQKTEFSFEAKELIKQAIDLYFLNDRQEAIQIINKLIEQESASSNSNNNNNTNNTNLSYLYGVKGFLHEILQQGNESIQALQRAYDLCVSDDKINALIFQASIFKQSNRKEEGLKCLDEVLSIDPKNIYALFCKAYDSMASKLEEAIKAGSQAIEISPQNEYLNMLMGQLMYQDKKYDEGIRFYEKAIEIRQNYFRAYFNKGLLLAELKRYEEAVVVYNRALKINPKKFDLVGYDKAQSLKHLEKYIEAIEIFDELIKIDPNDIYFYYGKLECLESLKQHQKVIDCGINYIKLFQKESYFYRICARAYSSLDQPENTIKLCDEWIKEIPNDFEAYQKKVDGLKKIEATKTQVIEVYQAYLKINPNHLSSLQEICNELYNKKDQPEELLQYADRLIKQAPDVALGYFYKGVALGNLERYEEAQIQLDKSIEIYPDTNMNYQQKARFYNSQKLHKEALESINKSLQFDGNDEYSLRLKALILNNMQEYKEANAVIDKCIALKQQGWGMLYIKYDCLIRMNMLEEALKTLKEVSAINTNKTYYKELIGILYNLEKYEEINELLEKGLLQEEQQQKQLTNNEDDEGIDWIYFQKGKNYLKMKKQKEALECFDKCIDLTKIGQRAQEAAGLKVEILENQKDYEQIIQTYDRIIARDQNCGEAYKQQGLAYQKLNKLSEAYNSFEKAVLKDCDLFEQFAVVATDLDKETEYINCCKKAFEQRGKFWKGVCYTLCFYYRDQRWDEKQANYYLDELEKDKLSEIDKQDISEDEKIKKKKKLTLDQFNYERAIILKNAGQTKEAIAKLNEITQNSNEKLYKNALLLQEMKQFTDALKCIKKHNELNPKDEKALELQNQLLQQVKEQTQNIQLMTQKIKEQTENIKNEIKEKEENNLKQKSIPQKKTMLQLHQETEIAKEKAQFSLLDVAISLEIVNAEFSVVQLKVQNFEVQHMLSILENIKTKKKENDQKIEEYKKSGTEIPYEFLKEHNNLLLQFQKQLKEIDLEVSKIKKKQEQQDEALTYGGVYDQSNAKIALEKLQKENPKFHIYYKTMYWTLMNYFQAYRVANTDVLQHNQNNSIETHEKLGKQAVQGVLSIAKPIPIIGGFVGMINSVIDSVFAMVQEKRFTDKKIAINKIIVSKFNTETEFNLKIMQAAIAITELKKQQILNVDKEVANKDSQKTTMDKIKNVISSQITKIKVNLSLLSPQEQQSNTCQLALNDCTLLLLFMFKNADSITSNSDALDKQLSAVISTNLIQNQFNQYTCYEVAQNLEQEQKQQDSSQSVAVVKTSSCCNVF